MMMTGMITAQIVISHSPGTRSKTMPAAIAMPATIEAMATGTRYGTAAFTVSAIVMSPRPSRSSCTALTSAACSKKAPNMLAIKARNGPTSPARPSSAATTAAPR
jgi:hypothetical protein